MGAIPEIAHFEPFPDIQPLNPARALEITNTNEQRFALALLTLQSVLHEQHIKLAAYHEPGRVTPPPEKIEHCKHYTIPDFLVIARFQVLSASLEEMIPLFYEVGTCPHSGSGRLKSGKAKQRRTLQTTQLPVGVLGNAQLDEIEKLLYQQWHMEALQRVLATAGVKSVFWYNLQTR